MPHKFVFMPDGTDFYCERCTVLRSDEDISLTFCEAVDKTTVISYTGQGSQTRNEGKEQKQKSKTNPPSKKARVETLIHGRDDFEINGMTSGMLSTLSPSLQQQRGVSELKFHFEDLHGMVSTSDGGSFLVLEELPQVFHDRYGNIPTRLFVRPCYVELYDVVMQWMGTTGFRGMVFTGVPGIGKSMFLIYFLCRRSKDSRVTDKNFAYETEQGRYHYFQLIDDDDGDVESPTRFHYLHSVTRSEFRLHETVLFADIEAKAEPAYHAKYAFVFSSPESLRYKEFMKARGYHKMTVPTWGQEEFELCTRTNESRNAQSNSNESWWWDRYVKCGGVPRVVLDTEIDSDQYLDAAVASMVGIADHFFTYGHGWSRPNEGVNYALVHINPPRNEGSEAWDYEGEAVSTFASDFVFNMLVSKLQRGQLSRLISWFNGGVASENFGPVSAGNLFEKLCLWLVPIYKKPLKASNLISLSENLIGRFPTFPTFPTTTETLKQNWKMEEHSVNVFYLPGICNLESGVAFCMVDDGNDGFVLIVVQVTVAENHPIKANGLDAILNSFSLDVQRKVARKVLLFVTPKDGKLKTEQPLIAQVRTATQRQKSSATGFEQVAYRYKMAAPK